MKELYKVVAWPCSGRADRKISAGHVYIVKKTGARGKVLEDLGEYSPEELHRFEGIRIIDKDHSICTGCETIMLSS